jgi:hypothetical protein
MFANKHIKRDSLQMKKSSNPVARSRRGAAEAFVDECVASGHYGFSLADDVRATGLSDRNAKNQLHRLRGRTLKVARWQPFFLINGPAGKASGAASYDRWLDDYFAWLGRPYYVGLQSAAAIHGSQPQALQTIQIVTDAPRRDAQVGRQKLRFFVKSDCAVSAVQQAPRAFAPMKVSTPETTAFDLVRYAPRLGGIGRTAETLAPMLHLLQPARLKIVLAAEDEISTMQRLGFLLEAMGRPKLAAAVETCLPSRYACIPLAVGATCPAGAPRHQRWHVVDNAGITSWS